MRDYKNLTESPMLSIGAAIILMLLVGAVVYGTIWLAFL